MRSVEVRRAERAWFTRNRNGLDAAWVALVLLNVVAIAAGRVRGRADRPVAPDRAARVEARAARRRDSAGRRRTARPRHGRAAGERDQAYVRRRPHPAVRHRRERPDPIAVSDTGSGIEAGELAHVFDRFRTGPNANGTRGTGLGLALVRAVADAHGGSARVRSVPGEGSEFEITLPAG